MNFLDRFRLADEKDDFQKVSETIEKGVSFRGTNLWVLVFAIFIASLGLNVNSTAVIIGAMLVSPLMGPIMGMGFGMAINDLALLRKSISSYVFAAGVGLATSTVYFLLSPINAAHSEILARTSPNIYDVLIALFGGLAGMLATSSRLKGNVIPGVAIATALMPPLCTAGYGLATQQFQFFFGAFYLFLINTVFISLATLLTTRFLNYPFKHLPRREDEMRARRVVWVVVVVTVLPSLYFGYDIVQQTNFMANANRFVEHEAVFPNDYLLKKTIDPKTKTIVLTYGGQVIGDGEIEKLRNKLPAYNLANITLEVRQGFSYLENEKKDDQSAQFTLALAEKDKQIEALKNKIDSTSAVELLSSQVYREVKAQYPDVQSFLIERATRFTDGGRRPGWVVVVRSKSKWSGGDKEKLIRWLRVRLNVYEITLCFEQ